MDPAALESIRRGRSAVSDAEAAELLSDRLSSLMISVATGGPSIKDVNDEYKQENRTLRAVLTRLRINYPNPFDDLWRWYGKWSDGSLPTYASRRAFISDLFSPVIKALDAAASRQGDLAEGVESGPTGWPGIDQKMDRLRRLFRDAEDSDEYNAVGLQCVSLLMAVADQVFDPDRDVPAGQETPGPDDAKGRIGLFLGRVATGKRHEHVRKLVNAAYGQANTAKHRRTASRLDAGIAANATALIVSTLRLFTDEGEESPPVEAPF